MDIQSCLADIDREHAEIWLRVRRLPQVCSDDTTLNSCRNCTQHTTEDCANTIAEIIEALLDLSWKHAAHEELLMKHLCASKDYLRLFGAHIEDHADLTLELSELAARPFSTNPAAIIRGINGLGRHWLQHHHAAYDLQLVSMAYAHLRENHQTVA